MSRLRQPLAETAIRSRLIGQCTTWRGGDGGHVVVSERSGDSTRERVEGYQDDDGIRQRAESRSTTLWPPCPVRPSRQKVRGLLASDSEGWSSDSLPGALLILICHHIVTSLAEAPATTVASVHEVFVSREAMHNGRDGRERSGWQRALSGFEILLLGAGGPAG